MKVNYPLKKCQDDFLNSLMSPKFWFKLYFFLFIKSVPWVLHQHGGVELPRLIAVNKEMVLHLLKPVAHQVLLV